MELVFAIPEGIIKGLFNLAFGKYDETEELLSSFSEYYPTVLK
jgi:hypothetical protein